MRQTRSVSSTRDRPFPVTPTRSALVSQSLFRQFGHGTQSACAPPSSDPPQRPHSRETNVPRQASPPPCRRSSFRGSRTSTPSPTTGTSLSLSQKWTLPPPRTLDPSFSETTRRGTLVPLDPCLDRERAGRTERRQGGTSAPSWDVPGTPGLHGRRRRQGRGGATEISLEGGRATGWPESPTPASGRPSPQVEGVFGPEGAPRRGPGTRPSVGARQGSPALHRGRQERAGAAGAQGRAGQERRRPGDAAGGGRGEGPGTGRAARRGTGRGRAGAGRGRGTGAGGAGDGPGTGRGRAGDGPEGRRRRRRAARLAHVAPPPPS